MASIAKTPLGKYRVQWREDGRQRQKNFASHAEAKKFAAALELSPQKRRSTISVGDWIANYRDTEAIKKWDEGTKNGPDRSALLGHNFVYQETKPHGFYSSYFHQRISS